MRSLKESLAHKSHTTHSNNHVPVYVISWFIHQNMIAPFNIKYSLHAQLKQRGVTANPVLFL